MVSTQKGAEGQDFVHGEEILLTEKVDETYLGYVLELVEDEEMRKRIGRNARKKIEQQYSWKKVVEKFEGVYSKIST